MYTIKIVSKVNGGKGVFVTLLSSENVNYYNVSFNTKEEYKQQCDNILGKEQPYHCYGNAISNPEEGNFIAMCLYSPDKNEWLLIEKAVVYIMQEGKTIDKLTAY